MEELKEVDLISGDPTRTLQIGSNLEPSFELELSNFLRLNADMLTWKAEDLEGIPHEKAVHYLNVEPKFRPVKQKKRTFGPERNKLIKAEVDKLLEAGNIRPIQYLEWFSNVVLVAKTKGKWQLCVDFTELNRVCSRDPFPLPMIDQLIDSTAE